MLRSHSPLGWLTFILLCVLGCLLTACTNDDTLQTTLWLEQANLEEVEAHEKSEGGTWHESQLTKDAKVYMRSTSEELPLKVRYYFSPEKKVKKVMYEWSKVIPDLTPEQLDSIMTAEQNNMDIYNKQFDKVATYLTDKYGFAHEGDGHLKKERFEMLDMWKRQLIWKKGKQIIQLNMVWVPKSGYRIFKVFCESTWAE